MLRAQACALVPRPAAVQTPFPMPMADHVMELMIRHFLCIPNSLLLVACRQAIGTRIHIFPLRKPRLHAPVPSQGFRLDARIRTRLLHQRSGMKSQTATPHRPYPVVLQEMVRPRPDTSLLSPNPMGGVLNARRCHHFLVHRDRLPMELLNACVLPVAQIFTITITYLRNPVGIWESIQCRRLTMCQCLPFPRTWPI
jgi:hypothetical protein